MILSACGGKIRQAEAFLLGTHAYLYRYPLVLMHVTRQVGTAAAAPEGMRAPANQFAHLKRYPDASFTDVVRANLDTLYSTAWLDLSSEPIVLSVPDSKGRHYLMPIPDAWSNVIGSPGSRTTGTSTGHFAITGPDWNGALPPGIKQQIKSPTSCCWIIGRTQTDGPEDYAVVNALQQQYKLTPLIAFGEGL